MILGFPVFILQNAQALVQISPNIINVACFFCQHSPILGQAASSHTVVKLYFLTIELVTLNKFVQDDPHVLKIVDAGKVKTQSIGVPLLDPQRFNSH